MKMTAVKSFARTAIVWLTASSLLNADDTFKQQLLKLFPQADANGDGVLSDAEEAEITRRALKRNPQADKDGDGVLSAAEKEALLRMAARRTRRKPGRKKQPPAPVSSPHYARHTFKSDDGVQLDYWLMPPATVEEGRKYPLVLSLHGRGGSTAAASSLATESNRQTYPCFVMAPRVDSSVSYWNLPDGIVRPGRKPLLPAALQAMDTLIAELPIDATRLYVTGQSMGGFGTFAALASRPDTFAAAIPVAGGWTPEDALKIKQIPIWIFHGDADKTVSVDYSRKISQALKDAGGSPKYTEYPGVGHNSWTKTYANPQTFRWLFQQQRMN